MPFGTLRTEYGKCGDDVVTGLEAGDAVCAIPKPLLIKPTISLTFDGNFAEVVGADKSKFLGECTVRLSLSGSTLECVDARPGSVIVDVQGSKDALDAAEAEVEANGLDLPSFTSLVAGVIDGFAPSLRLSFVLRSDFVACARKEILTLRPKPSTLTPPIRHPEYCCWQAGTGVDHASIYPCVEVLQENIFSRSCINKKRALFHLIFKNDYI